MLHLYDSNVSNFQFQLKFNEVLVGGIDGISIWLILLVNKVNPIVILNSWKNINQEDNFKRFII